ncbi:MAG: cyclic nucleotide-binding domain-containing protein [Desulfomonile tiedjei]|uniref:Cyclic nucleotide-binding domain-containing protein n=1 Tax=Desulfomonile tiedjei TaxID=2358 RepID=A0A9D6Z3W0_9BACT|nr:cyclic nucleotide-binding domain-containing protein [Desulfomonile tiedjei]
MIIQEAELFRGIDEQAMNEIAKIMVLEIFEKGTVLFTPQRRADDFFILWEGRVRLAMGDEAQLDYIVSKRGEVFGWSGLVDREFYYAHAECVEPSRVYKIHKETINAIFEKHPASGMVFYKRLAGAVVQRLVYGYETLLREGRPWEVTSFGTRQVMAGAED